MSGKKQMDFFPRPVAKEENNKAIEKKAPSKVKVKPKKKSAKSKKAKLAEIANPPHGSKSDFVKVTITLPPNIYQEVMTEATRRKIAKEPNPQLSAVIREALVHYLKA